MKVLFVLLGFPKNYETSSEMYSDMVLQFKKNGHDVYVISGDPQKTQLINDERLHILRVKSLPIVYVKSMIQKGIGMALLPHFFLRAYKKFFKAEKFDWIVMPTPPITAIDFVKKVKKWSGAKFYMILRDIHPQSSASLGEIRYKWMVNYLYRRSDLGYRLADVIGCMSQANIDFIKSCHNIPESSRCTVLYNWMTSIPYTKEDDSELRSKYNLQGKFLVLFGGNIGLGQRIENIVDLAKHYIANKDVVFVVIGKGIKKQELQDKAIEQNLTNILFVDFMPREDYLKFVKSVDLGLISINENNAAPTCPSKALSYMSLKIPILALINRNSDYGQIIENAGAGYWSVGSDKVHVYELFDKLLADADLRKQMGENGYKFYCENLTTEKVYNDLIGQMSE